MNKQLQNDTNDYIVEFSPNDVLLPMSTSDTEDSAESVYLNEKQATDNAIVLSDQENEGFLSHVDSIVVGKTFAVSNP